MRLRSALFLATSAIPLALTSCAAALSWDGFSGGTEPSEGGRTDTGVPTVDGGADTSAASDSDTRPPITYVQSASFAFAPNDPDQPKVVAKFSKAQVKGDLNVVAVGWYNGIAISSVTDTKGNVYTKAIGPTTQPKVATNGGPVTHAVYYARNIVAAAAGENDVTVTYGGLAENPDLRIAEYFGLDPTDPFEGASEGKDYTGEARATYTTKTDRVLLISTGATDESFNNGDKDWITRIISSQNSILQERIVQQKGTYTATASINDDTGTATTAEWVLHVAAFR